ncbi:MAG: molybdopterin cofactor-binding domain-containing protein, partial [Planctomycetota bacterium]|nr:molybdopterin cofactor-binding domain-containing protein [Planctomycetota bacterium]
MSDNFSNSQIIKDPGDNYKTLGTRPVRHDGVDKVTGRAIYGNDVQLQGLIEGAILRSPVAHARIKSIDTSAAEAFPGVLAVATSADFPDPKDKVADLGEGPVNLAHLSANCLARDKVFYKGQAIAAVAARDVHIAEEALSLIKVEYELLPVLTRVLDAMKEGSPLLHEDLRTNEMGKKADTPSNISDHLHFEQGDPDTAFENAHLVVEREFKTQTVHQGYIEPHVATAHWNQDGHLTVWASTQGAFSAREQTAETLALPVSKVKVIPCEIGGGFGGKIPIYLEPVAAVLSRKSGRPVKIQMTRDGVFEGTGPTPASFMRIKVGVDEAGKILAAEAWLAYETGAYPGGVIGPG